MRMKSRFLFPFLLLFALIGCGETTELDGAWAPMAWKGIKNDKGFIDVEASAEGDTLVFTCLNYRKPWLSSLEEEEQTYYPPRDGSDESYRHIEGQYMQAVAVGSEVRIVIAPNASGKSRKILLVVTAGDIFDHFRITQPTQ